MTKAKVDRASETASNTIASEPSPTDSDLGMAFAVGHKPSLPLAPQDVTLFKAFQSNLLSLISHELRTPLMGILNALSLLDESNQDASELSASELISMARRNAHRLQQTLASLLDLASLESGTFHARLREVDLPRVVRGRVQSRSSFLKDQQIEVDLRVLVCGESSDHSEAPLLADPQKLGRAIDLCLDVAVPRIESGASMEVEVHASRFELKFPLKAGIEEQWRASWSQAVAGYEGGVVQPGSAFAGALQTEQAFLSRMEEGLGSEFLLILEIARLHHARFTARFDPDFKDRTVALTFELPELSSEEGLRAVLASRAYQASMDLGTVALALVQIPAGVPPGEFRANVKKNLFRATDAVYLLPESSQVALVMDDCKPEDTPRLLGRIEKAIGQPLRHGIATFPIETPDPSHLLDLASRKLEQHHVRPG